MSSATTFRTPAPTVRAWCADDNVDLVFTPTHASWSLWIEAEFAALRSSALTGTDHRTHAEQNAEFAAYIRWHNTKAEPMIRFATGSPIRTWTPYTTRVA